MGVTTSDPLLAEALVCVDQFYARLFRDWPSAITRQQPCYTLSFSGDRRLTGANHLWPNAPDAITDEALADAEHFFAAHEASWSAIVTEPLHAGAFQVLEAHDYYPRWDSPLMLLDRAPRALPTRPNAHVLAVETAQQLQDVTTVMAEAFATGSSVNRRIVRPEHLHSGQIYHYLIYAERVPAASATVALHGNGLASIWNVGTRYRFRRQRYATTLMLALLDSLRLRGYHISTLMASYSGQPLYEQLGYRIIGRTAYMAPPLLPARVQ